MFSLFTFPLHIPSRTACNFSLFTSHPPGPRGTGCQRISLMWLISRPGLNVLASRAGEDRKLLCTEPRRSSCPSKGLVHAWCTQELQSRPVIGTFHVGCTKMLHHQGLLVQPGAPLVHAGAHRGSLFWPRSRHYGGADSTVTRYVGARRCCTRYHGRNASHNTTTTTPGACWCTHHVRMVR